MPTLNPQQFTTLYHGTSPEKADWTQEHGLTPPESVMSAGWPMLTSSRPQAARYGKGRVLEYRFPPEAMDYRNTEGVLWPGQEHDVYGHKATAYGVKGSVPSKYLHAVHEED